MRPSLGSLLGGHRSVAAEALWQLGRGDLIHRVAQVQQLIQPIGDRAVRQAGGPAVPPRLIIVEEVRQLRPRPSVSRGTRPIARQPTSRARLWASVLAS